MINAKEFVKRFTRKLNSNNDINVVFNQNDATLILEGFQELVLEMLIEDNKIKINDFLIFKSELDKAHDKRMPNGETILIPDRIKMSAELTEKYKIKT